MLLESLLDYIESKFLCQLFYCIAIISIFSVKGVKER